MISPDQRATTLFIVKTIFGMNRSGVNETGGAMPARCDGIHRCLCWGCANAPLSKNVVDKINADSETFIADKAHALQPYYRALYVEGEHNAVLNFMYLGLAAMERGYYEDAERAFDGAIQRIEAIYGEDPHAKMAKAYGMRRR